MEKMGETSIQLKVWEENQNFDHGRMSKSGCDSKFSDKSEIIENIIDLFMK